MEELEREFVNRFFVYEMDGEKKDHVGAEQKAVAFLREVYTAGKKDMVEKCIATLPPEKHASYIDNEAEGWNEDGWNEFREIAIKNLQALQHDLSTKE